VENGIVVQNGLSNEDVSLHHINSNSGNQMAAHHHQHHFAHQLSQEDKNQQQQQPVGPEELHSQMMAVAHQQQQHVNNGHSSALAHHHHQQQQQQHAAAVAAHQQQQQQQLNAANVMAMGGLGVGDGFDMSLDPASQQQGGGPQLSFDSPYQTGNVNPSIVHPPAPHNVMSQVYDQQQVIFLLL